jgi:ADP-ribosylglycohydrolase
MLGAIAGDVIGSVFEASPIKTREFPLFQPRSSFTDDTVLTVAIAYAILHDDVGYARALRHFTRRFPSAGYGGGFFRWAMSDSARPYNSWGNGSAMRVSPIAYAHGSPELVLHHAARSAAVTHNHPEGIRGAQATALAVFLARQGAAKEEIRREVESRFGYNLSRTIAEIRPHYRFEVACQDSVPEALIAFLEAADFEDAVRTAVSLGGDSDTQACIAGAIAEPFFGGVPATIRDATRARLAPALLDVVDEFVERFL